MADPISFRPLTDAEKRRAVGIGRDGSARQRPPRAGLNIPDPIYGGPFATHTPPSPRMTRPFDGDGARRILENNEHEILVADEEHAEAVWRQVKLGQGMSEAEVDKKWEELLHFVGNNTAAYGVAAGDSIAFGKVAYDISRGGAGWKGVKAVFTSYQNQKYIIFKGYNGLRHLLPGTRYLRTNPKIVQLGLGSFDVAKSVKSGGIFTAVLLCGFHVMDYLVRDTATLSQLIGNLGVDLAKVAISTGVGFAASAALAGTVIATVAVGPLAFAILVGIGAAVLLDIADSHWNVKGNVISTLEKIWENFEVFFSRPDQVFEFDPAQERRAYFEDSNRRALNARARLQGRF